MKKLTIVHKLIITLSSLILVLILFSVLSAYLSVNRTEEAIDDLATITYSPEGEAALDKAISYYNKLDRNLKLEKKVSNYEKLEEAKINYSRLSIKRAYVAYERRIAESYSDADLIAFVADATATLEKYLDEDDYVKIANYDDYTFLFEIYGTTSSDEPKDSQSSDSEEEIEIC